MNASYQHMSVLPEETLQALELQKDGLYVDATMGGAGHTKMILQELGSEARMVLFDQDEAAWGNAPKDDRVLLVKANFRYLYRFLDFHNALNADGILADLGVSSHHFDTPERGFSLRFEGPLDMRMDRRSSVTAEQILAEYSVEELQEIFSKYGELRNSKTVAKTIVEQRKIKTIKTTQELKLLLQSFVRGNEHRYWAQLFQALRIEVNQELKVLEQFLVDSRDALKPGGRLVIITFHSLEDRIVKRFFRNGGFLNPIEKDVMGREIEKRQMKELWNCVASEEELKLNPRAKSARLRVGIKL